MTSDLASIGLRFDRWQDAVEAAIATDQLDVTGEVRGGQLVQFSDPAGSQINILAVEPFSTWAGFKATTQILGHVTMLNDVLGIIEVVDQFGTSVADVTAHIAQGPLLVDEPVQQWQQVGVTALMESADFYSSPEAFQHDTGNPHPGVVHSPGAEIVTSGSGSEYPDASVELSGRVIEAGYRTAALTGQRFVHLVLDAAFPLDVCLPDSVDLPEPGTVISGRGTLTASIAHPAASGGGCGGCGSGCGCGG